MKKVYLLISETGLTMDIFSREIDAKQSLEYMQNTYKDSRIKPLENWKIKEMVLNEKAFNS